QQMQSLEGWLESVEQELKDVVMAKLQRENLRLERLEGEIKAQSQIYCQRALSRLELYQGQLHTLTEQILLREKERLRSLDQIVASHSPKRIMQLGFAVVRQASGAITSAQGLSVGERVQIEFAQGAIEAEVKRVLE
ncbi:MAG: exodeoxyribonuclease VII large subunit, partial [Alistipes sp.]|nr:exodeoxyribonuclease VII large subunit [Alistipes sp.]